MSLWWIGLPLCWIGRHDWSYRYSDFGGTCRRCGRHKNERRTTHR